MNLAGYLALAVGAYLLGALPTGYLVGRAGRGVDVRQYGSGSTGATNVMRLLGPLGFVLVFIGDFGKAFLAIWGAGALGGGPAGQALAGLMVLIGHNWPVFLGFKGGRGVASGVGGLFALVPVPSAICLVSAAILMGLTRYVSLGSIVGTALSVPLTAWMVWQGQVPAEYLGYVIPGVAIIIVRHRENLRRLAAGTERRLGDKVKVDAAAGTSNSGQNGRHQARVV